MAIELHVFVERSAVPNVDFWNREISASGFPCAINSEFDPQQCTGFVPAKYEGKDTGFEFDLASSTEVLDSYPQVSELVRHRNACATFRWGGNILEMSAAISAAAALTKLSDGIYFFPDDNVSYDSKQVIEATKSELGI